MNSIQRGLVTAMAAGALFVVPMSTSRITRAVLRPTAPPDPKTLYSSRTKEFWLSAEQFDYVRPGLKITVNSITIGADNKAIVDLTFTDDLGQPLDRHGAITPGAFTPAFILAWWDPATRNYTAYTTRTQTSPITGVSATQAGTDSGGTFTDIDLGHATYKFGRALPAGYDASATTTLGIYATRDLITPGIADKNYYANVEQDFIPASGFPGAAPAQVWDVIDAGSCNKCHDPLSAHGGARRDVKLCVLCHSPQTTDPDTGNTVDFKVMVHKIHMGGDLPSVQAGGEYHIIGFNQGDNIYGGDPLKKVPDVAFPQDIRNCTTCHGSTDPSQPNYATQAFNWFAYPNRAACQSCHDDVDFATGANHPAGAQANDSQCATCHVPTSGGEWNAAVIDAHTVPFKSTQLKGINATILSVTSTAPGQNPTIKFQLKQNDGTPIAPASFGNFLAVIMGGPTVDYAINPFRETASGAAFDGTTATYTFTNAVPSDATGTWAFSVEARRSVTLDPAPIDLEPPTVNESAFNPVFYAAVTDSQATPRRQVVDLANCNTCHDQLMLHGSFRKNTEMCVICHNPNANDSSRRPADQSPAESVDMKRMIHRIHTGEDLETGDSDCASDPNAPRCFTIYGFGTPPSVNNFNEVRFPGDRRDCLTCHAADTQQIPDNTPAGRLPTMTPRDWYSPMQPIAAACLGCHDTQAAAAHAYSMTAPFGEACAACHGPNAEFAVDKVHAR